MLVLSRKLGEKIVIDGGIIITVIKINANQVRIGIEAPGNVHVWRKEIVPAPRGDTRGIHAPESAPEARKVRRATKAPKTDG